MNRNTTQNSKLNQPPSNAAKMQSIFKGFVQNPLQLHPSKQSATSTTANNTSASTKQKSTGKENKVNKPLNPFKFTHTREECPKREVERAGKVLPLATAKPKYPQRKKPQKSIWKFTNSGTVPSLSSLSEPRPQIDAALGTAATENPERELLAKVSELPDQTGSIPSQETSSIIHHETNKDQGDDHVVESTSSDTKNAENKHKRPTSRRNKSERSKKQPTASDKCLGKSDQEAPQKKKNPVAVISETPVCVSTTANEKQSLSSAAAQKLPTDRQNEPCSDANVVTLRRSRRRCVKDSQQNSEQQSSSSQEKSAHVQHREALRVENEENASPGQEQKQEQKQGHGQATRPSRRSGRVRKAVGIPKDVSDEKRGRRTTDVKKTVARKPVKLPKQSDDQKTGAFEVGQDLAWRNEQESSVCGELLANGSTTGHVLSLVLCPILNNVCDLPDSICYTSSILDYIRALCRVELAQCKSDPRLEAEVRVHKKSKNRSVKFQTFDLSCVDLQYNETNVSAVENTLEALRGLETTVLSLQQRVDDNNHSNIVSSLQAIEARLQWQDFVPAPGGQLPSTRLPITSKEDIVDSTVSAFFNRAWSDVSEEKRRALRRCAAFIREEISTLRASLSTKTRSAYNQSPLMQRYSFLLSSAVRFYLRKLFAPEFLTEAFHKVQEDGSGELRCPYDMQDLGSAVHRALNEFATYRPAARNIVPHSDDSEIQATIQCCKKRARKGGKEELEVLYRYCMAHRFLSGVFAYLDKECDSKRASGSPTIRTAIRIIMDRLLIHTHEIERCCFEDEFHLLPLRSVTAFHSHLLTDSQWVSALMEGLSHCSRIVNKSVLMANTSADQPSAHKPNNAEHTLCPECKQAVFSFSEGGSIRCKDCVGLYHLACLHLPPDFANFAGSYSCPACYLV